jgi:hypothetical protein
MPLRVLPTSNTQNENPTYPVKPLKYRAAVGFWDGLSPSVASVQQPRRRKPANVSIRHARQEGIMLRLTHFTTDGRLLGFDTGDWSMLLGGFVLAGLLTLFV